MTSAEQNYAQIEKELLAIVWSLERFDTYVYLNPQVTVETDHKPLLAINRKALGAAPKRLQRMLLRLLRYKSELTFKPGSDMLIVDTLSRAYLPTGSGCGNMATSSSLLWDELAELVEDDDLQLVASDKLIAILERAAPALHDDEYQLLKQQTAAGWPPKGTLIPDALKAYETFSDELTGVGQFVFNGQRVIVPCDARSEVLNRLHASHTGVNACLRRARDTVFYPGITRDIKRLVEACDICQRHLSETGKEPLRPHPVPTRQWQRVGVDIFTHMSNDYLVTVDYLSGYFEVDPLTSKRGKDVIDALRRQFARHGIPETVVSDNSPFNSREFKTFASRWEFKHVTSSPNYSQSNGRAENAVKTVKRLMQKAAESGTDPLLAILEWRNTPAESSNLSPAQIMFGRQTRTLIPSCLTKLKGQPATAAANDQHRAALKRSKDKQAAYYNRSASSTERDIIDPGQTVRVKFADGDWRKAEVIKPLPNRAYDVRLPDGTERRRTSRHVRTFREKPIIFQTSEPPGDDDDHHQQ